MWRESRILLIDDNLQRRHDLAVIFDFLGEPCSSCSSSDSAAVLAPLESQQLSCVLLGQVDSKGPYGCFTSGLLHVLRRGRSFKWSALGGWMKRLGQ